MRNEALGLPDDREVMGPDYRRAVGEKIELGLRSLREGREVDGDDFFISYARDDGAELAEELMTDLAQS